MGHDESAVLEAIRAAHAQQLRNYVIKAWANWGTSEQRHIMTLPVALAPTLAPEVIFDRAKGAARDEILKCGYTPEEADAAKLIFEAVEQ